MAKTSGNDDTGENLAEAGDTNVARALAKIESAKQGATPDLIECLEAIADLVRTYRDPDLVFDRIQNALCTENLRALAAAHSLNLYESTQASAGDDTLTEVTVFWPAFAILPRGQKPADSLAQLRKAIAERERDHYLADSFQAAVAAGHTGNVDTWYDRTLRAWNAR